MTATEQVIKQNRNLYTSYIDFKKAYDSVPHSWLLKVLDIYKIDPIIKKLLGEIMKTWKTKLIVNEQNENIETEYIKINRGIFQGDGLSPLWFCLALNPLSNILRKSNKGIPIKHNKEVKYVLTHLLYMDDIKIYGKTERDLKTLLELTYTFSNDIKMEFGLEKCKTQTILKGKQQTNRIEHQNMPDIEPMKEEDMYKYLGVLQKKNTDHATMKKKVREKYLQRVNLILKSKLNSKNLINGINTYAIPLLTYSFGIIKWTLTELKDIQTKTNVTMTRHRIHHPKSAVERMTLKRKDGGRGLIDIVNLHNKSVLQLRQYFHQKQGQSEYYSAIVQADKYTPLHLSNEEVDLPITTDEEKIRSWKSKALHGRYPHQVSQDYVDSEASYNWLTEGELYPETEGFVISMQDQVTKTNNYRKYILKENVETDRCRKCKQGSETIHHIIGGCTTIAQTEYKSRHDNVGKILHQEMAKKYNLVKESTNYYQYIPETILENNDVEMYWDRTILTDKALAHNRPDITLWKKKEKEVQLIDIAVTNCVNLEKTYQEKINKYLDLCYEVKKLWKVNQIRIVPVVLSNLGTIPKPLFKSLKELDIKPTIYKKMQKSILLDTCHIARRFLSLD
ncbi:hypothetical protein WDU94_012394 [Cyamophila willieti]